MLLEAKQDITEECQSIQIPETRTSEAVHAKYAKHSGMVTHLRQDAGFKAAKVIEDP